VKHIPIHKLQDRASIGLEIGHTLNKGKKEELEAFDVHRDDNYIFLLIEKGAGAITVDFQEVALNKWDIYFIAPGQIHHGIRVGDSETWFASVTPSLIPKDYIKIFEGNLLAQCPSALDKPAFIQCRRIMRLLAAQYDSNPNDDFYRPLTYALLNSFLCTVARAYLAPATINSSDSRPFQITLKFRKMLAEKFKIEKRPSFYAESLHISEIYLNEAVKKITGFTVV
jgi:AraC family transcriptional activator of pobA